MEAPWIMDRSGIPQIESIRQAIREHLAAQGCDVSDIHEAILIRQGVYCGRRFECDAGSAVWFIEENQIKYFGGDGALVKTVRLPSVEPKTVPLRRAA